MIDFFSRLDNFMKFKGLNDNKITIEAGISNGLIGKARIRGALSQDNISKILCTYCELDANWLLTGKGEMLKDETEKNYMYNSQFTINEDSAEYGVEVLNNVLSKNKVKEKKIPTAYHKPEENKPPTSYYLPEVYASAGLDKGIINDELKREPVNIPWLETGLTFINVYGDSMYPKYNAGEVIGVKPIEFKYLNYGYPYVIVFSNGDVFIKIVQPGADKDHLMLESVNEFYKPKEFHLEQMKSFYSIKGVIKKEMM